MRKKLLSPAEEEILALSWQGLSSSEVAETLGKKIAYVSKTKGIIRRKINEGLEELARSLMIDYSELDTKFGKAIIEGYHFAIDTKVYLFFSIKEGFVAWYCHDRCIRNDSTHQKCQNILNLIKQERNIDEIENQENLTEEYENVWKWINEQGDMI